VCVCMCVCVYIHVVGLLATANLCLSHLCDTTHSYGAVAMAPLNSSLFYRALLQKSPIKATHSYGGVAMTSRLL